MFGRRRFFLVDLFVTDLSLEIASPSFPVCGFSVHNLPCYTQDIHLSRKQDAEWVLSKILVAFMATRTETAALYPVDLWAFYFQISFIWVHFHFKLRGRAWSKVFMGSERHKNFPRLRDKHRTFGKHKVVAPLGVGTSPLCRND